MIRQFKDVGLEPRCTRNTYGAFLVTFHFPSLAGPAVAGAKVTSHFWASCLFVLDLLHLVTRTHTHTS